MKKQITLALDPGMLDALRTRARREHRSVSNLIEFWMTEAVTAVPSGSGSPDTAPGGNDARRPDAALPGGR